MYMLKKLFYSLLIGGSLLVSIVHPAFADWKMDSSGNLVYSQPQVLGDEDEKKQEEKNENKVENQSKTEDRKENEEKLGERERETRKEMEKERERNQIGEKKEIKNEEIKSIDLDRTEDDQIEIKIETKKQEKIENVQDNFEIDDESDDADDPETDKIKISTGEGKGEFKIERNKIMVKTNYPLSVNPETKALTVTTPAGEKTITVLPDKAADIIKELGVVDDTGFSSDIEMETDKEKLVYKVKGKKREKLFGIMPVEVEKEVVMSAETGQLVDTNQTLMSKLLDALSF